MKQFQVAVRFTVGNDIREVSRAFGCREIFISVIRAASFGITWSDMQTTLYTEHELPETMLAQICGPAQLTWHENKEQTVGFPSHLHAYVFQGNDNTILEAFYWLILGERLYSYYVDNFLKMIKAAQSYEWDLRRDQLNSIRRWKEYERGNIIPTQELLNIRNGPIIHREGENWK